MSRVSNSKKSLVSHPVLSLVLAGTAALAGRLVVGAPAQLDQVIRLEFVILDDETSRPVKDAAVQLIDPFGEESDDGEALVMFSDERGKAALSRDFDLGELLNDAKNGDRIRVVGWRVKVSARGYRASTTPLFELTREGIDERNPKVKHPEIRLHRELQSKTDLGPQFATFVYRDFGMRISLVFSGDKFDALLSCPKLCSEHTPWFEAKYGDLKSMEGVLHLSVRSQELIRRRDGEKFEWLQNNLLPVTWGKRQYLVSTEQAIAFCNAVNLGEEPRDSEYGDFALREGQHELAVTGMPEVPKEWSQYLLKDPVLGEVIEMLPDSKARINVGRKQGLRVGMKLVPIEERYITMEIVGIDERVSVVKIQQGIGADRQTRLGEIVSTRCPPLEVTVPKNP
jgi:hypothetical protein